MTLHHPERQIMLLVPNYARWGNLYQEPNQTKEKNQKSKTKEGQKNAVLNVLPRVKSSRCDRSPFP